MKVRHGSLKLKRMRATLAFLSFSLAHLGFLQVVQLVQLVVESSGCCRVSLEECRLRRSLSRFDWPSHTPGGHPGWL